MPENLVRFLKYIGSNLPESQKNFRDGYVKQLQTAVREVKANREMEVMYMTLQELPGSLPKKIRKRIFSETDNETLCKYLRLAASAGSVEEFVQRM